MTERDYFSELKINKFALDEEWLEQPEKGMYWAKQAAIAQTELDSIDMNRKIMKANLGKKYRIMIEDSGRKSTESMLQELIRTDPEYLNLTEQLIVAKENFEILEAAKWQFSMRKTSLEKIQEGIIMGLFSDPRSSGEMMANEEKMREGITKRREKR